MTTYKEMYNDYLDEIGRAGVENYSMLLENGDETAYNCGFNDFADAGFTCEECEEHFYPGYPEEDDQILCPKCRGEDA